MQRRILSQLGHAVVLLVLVTFMSAGVRAQDEEAVLLPLGRVVLFTSGVGYFERQGQVTGDAELELRFGADDINDLLKSLVVRDFDGGQIRTVRYSSRDPISKALKLLAIDLTGNPKLSNILEQVRGERIEIAAPSALEGVIVGTETKLRAAGENPPVPTEYLNLLAGDGLRSVALDQVERIRFLRPELQAEFQKALAILATGQDTEKKSVVLAFTGEGERRVSVGYLTESPLWKTSYRLVLADDGEPLIQGWAIVENTSDADWNGVEVTLVSGRPISFRMDLYEPLYVPRPLEELDLYASLRPEVHAESRLEGERRGAPAAPLAKSRRAARLRRPRVLALEDAEAAAESVPSVAEATEAGELFRYDITHPVTLSRQQSALLPIVNANLEGEKISIYNRSRHPKHPLNGLRLRNTTGLHLMQGPVTVFDGGIYAGDSKIGDLPPAAERWITYALDLDVEVLPTTKGRPDELVSVRLARGTLIASRELFREINYEIKNEGGETRQLIVEHPFQAGWELRQPKQEKELTSDRYRFPVTLEAGSRDTLKVVERRVLDERIALSTLGDSRIEIFQRSSAVSATVKEALAEIVRRRGELARTEAALQREQARINEINQEQSRIRQNMERLAQSSDLYRLYVRTLTEHEDELAQIRERIQSLVSEREQKEAALERYLLSLELE